MSKLLALIASIVLLASTEASPMRDITSSLPDFLDQPRYSEFKEELIKFELARLLRNIDEPMTIFAPTNEAMSQLKDAPWARGMGRERMKRMLTSIIVPKRKILPGDIRNDMVVEALSRDKLRLNVYPRGKTVNGVPFVKERNGETHFLIVYRINRFPMMPEEGHHLIESLHKHHSHDERLSTFFRIIEAAGLTELLKKAGPLTIFAPHNDAFKALPETKLTELFASPNSSKALLMSHVANGTYFQTGLLHSPDLHTLDGGSRQILNSGTDIELDSAKVLTNESAVAGNGVLHIINRVLLQ